MPTIDEETDRIVSKIEDVMRDAFRSGFNADEYNMLEIMAARRCLEEVSEEVRNEETKQHTENRARLAKEAKQEGARNKGRIAH